MVAASEYLLSTGTKANSFDVLNVEYSGNKVECDTKIVYKNNIYLSKCNVNGVEVKDSKSSDGYYQYGNITKYGDIYFNAANKALKRYYNNYDTILESIENLEINLNNFDFSCEVNHFNSDASLYLSKCSIAGNLIDDKYWGEYKHLIGDKVKYDNVEYYVIETGNNKSTSIHLLKAEPIKKSEIEEYLNNTELNGSIQVYPWDEHINMSYYYNDLCNTGTDTNNCLSQYDASAVKQIVDVWASAQAPDIIEARLITFDELMDNFSFISDEYNEGMYKVSENEINSWIYDIKGMFSSPIYWTMSSSNDSEFHIWNVGWLCQASCKGEINDSYVYNEHAVRPVITIKKSAL